jgi:hypothetical protein
MSRGDTLCWGMGSSSAISVSHGKKNRIAAGPAFGRCRSPCLNGEMPLPSWPADCAVCSRAKMPGSSPPSSYWCQVLKI